MSPKKSPPPNRILWDHGRQTVDEIVVSEGMVHLEALSDGYWYLALYPKGHNDRICLDIRGSIFVSEEVVWDEDDEHGS